ncbi:MAG: class I SAM-dependent methyltransferase [Alphaproteobacteria bacterium]|nr:class I SAM-dependent methyltransferase [Alphaproteobacteria bacterium]
MIKITDVRKQNFEAIPIDSFWNVGDERELKMHRIHAYPAKFPAFLTTKALEFAETQGLCPEKIADIFCGCGTVAYEARRNNMGFWGCDINPVATLIAKAKSSDYKEKRLEEYYAIILDVYSKQTINKRIFTKANDRLKYWYFEEQYLDLYRLKSSIYASVPKRSKYLPFFLCAFSNILKPTSKWLTKSIKPQVDPNKEPANVLSAFAEQFKLMVKASNESSIADTPEIKIETTDFLATRQKKPTVDMIITSPPYVTSYEYADLHQLSSLWLDFADDYRDLRQGSIGSLHHDYNFDREVKRLNRSGMSIVFNLLDRDKSKAKSVAKYFLDIQKTTQECHSMLSENGMALFVIGNTEYKGIRMDNARHLAESLFDCGFKDVLVTKRKITGKILTPYRTENGCFTSNKSGKKIYSEEFIIVGKK